MSLQQDVYRRYGLLAFVAAGAAAITIWALAHYNSAPGGVVKVLWGLVEYTKKTPTAAALPEAGSAAPSRFAAPPSLQQVPSGRGLERGRIEVLGHGYSETTYAQRQGDLRKQSRLRGLSELESGKPLESLPEGTFGFVDHIDLLVGGSEFQSRLSRVAVRRFPAVDHPSDPPFEVQMPIDGGPVLLAFSTETAATALVSTQTGEIAISPRPRGNFTTLLSVSISKLSDVHWRLVETGVGKSYFVMDVKVR